MSRGAPVVQGNDILMYMSRHPGMPYTAKQLASELSLEASWEAVGKAMAYQSNKGYLDRIGLGVYMYRHQPVIQDDKTPAPTTPIDEIFERMGETSDGRVIVRACDSRTIHVLGNL